MSFSKYNMTSNSLDNPNYEDQMKEHFTFNEMMLNNLNLNAIGTKPKGYPRVRLSSKLNFKQSSTHNQTLANFMQMMQNQDRARSLSISSSKEHNPALKKTKICDHWRRFGVCSYGDACWYAHGESDLRKLTKRFDEKPKENELEPKAAPKRASTNVKGLTVNIPHNATTETNSSLPLSPAQERWVSMSGQNPLKSNELEHETSGKMMLESARGGYGREEEANDIDDLAAFLSPNPYVCQPAFSARMAATAAQQRSFSRGAPRVAPAAHRPFQERQQLQHRSSSGMRTSREPFNQSLWNVAGELYQRQKDSDEQQFMAKLAKAKDMAHLRYMFEHGLLTERHVPREIWNELLGGAPRAFPTPLPPKNPAPDCSGCGGSTRAKEHTSLHSAFFQNQNQRVAHHHHAHSAHSALHHHQAPPPANPFRRAPPRELVSPPKMLESLLPADDGNFSIWFDSKSAEKSESSTSLLTKMEAFRSEKCPITEEEISSARSPANRSSIESWSPLLLGEPKMFDFDSLKIAETLNNASSSPTFFTIEEKTPSFEAKPMESCDFFTAGGSCPFGDSCHMSHKI